MRVRPILMTTIKMGRPPERRKSEDDPRTSASQAGCRKSAPRIPTACKQRVSYISRYFTLKPGDLIFTGTPEGVISGYPKEKQVWLKAGRRGDHVDREAGRSGVQADVREY